MHIISFFYHLIYYGTLAKSSLLVEFQGLFCWKSSFVPAVPIMQEPNRTLLDSCIHNDLWRWMGRRHRNKNTHWLKQKYLSKGSKPGRFSAGVKSKKGIFKRYELIKASSIHIMRHIKIRRYANPFDPQYKGYFWKHLLTFK